ncbi:DsrE family protein [Haladaptatus halobius]|uniref:DsrE family protein n=1 Tax=Haladaptatus halobius TaxID=2884875 RepID=UPI001D0B534F|nr:DsrE family protein [Haladaptatus halobius]
MAKAAIIILAGTESHADLGRITNALQTAKEFVDEGDDVEVIFDGAGTQWVAELEDEDHKLHSLYSSLDEYASVCEYCAGAFEVTDAAKSSDAVLLDEYEGHPSLHSLVTEGYEIITF